MFLLEPLWLICFSGCGDFALMKLEKVFCYGLDLKAFEFSSYETGALLLKEMLKLCTAFLETVATWAGQQYAVKGTDISECQLYRIYIERGFLSRRRRAAGVASERRCLMLSAH